MCFVVSLTRLNGLPMKKNRCEEKHIVPSRKWTLQAELCVASGWCLHHHPISPENWGPRGDSKDARWPGKHGRFRFCKHSASYPNKHLLSKLLILTSCIDAVSTFHPTPPPHIDHTTQAWFRNFEKNRDIQEFSIAFLTFSGRISSVISCARTAHCCQEVIEFAQLQTNLACSKRWKPIRPTGEMWWKPRGKPRGTTCRDIVLVQPNNQASDHPMKRSRRTEQPEPETSWDSPNKATWLRSACCQNTSSQNEHQQAQRIQDNDPRSIASQTFEHSLEEWVTATSQNQNAEQITQNHKSLQRRKDWCLWIGHFLVCETSFDAAWLSSGLEIKSYMGYPLRRLHKLIHHGRVQAP